MTIIESLQRIVGASHVLYDQAHTAGYSCDYTRRWSTTPLAVVRPETTNQVAEIVHLAIKHHISLTPQGGNTSLVGGGIGQDGCIIVSTQRLTHAKINPIDRTLHAGAGLTIARAQALAEQHDLIFPINTASRDSATLGGIIATNAGGTRTIRWGATRQHVLGITAVRGDGTIVSRMRALHRDNIGIDLPQLFVGSEGTLGIITDTLFRLQPLIHIPSFAIFLPLNTLHQGHEILHHATSTGCIIEAAEFMTNTGVNLVSAAMGISNPFPQSPLIGLLEISTQESDPYTHLGNILTQSISNEDLDHVIIEPCPAPKLWQLRENHTETINKTTITPVIKLDVSLPHSQLDQYLTQLPDCLQPFSPAYPICFGHFGEGNVHTNILDSSPQDYTALSTAVFELVSSLGGSISAEHGIGRAKIPWIHLNRTPQDLATMQDIRTLFDPHHILVPELLDYSSPHNL